MKNLSPTTSTRREYFAAKAMQGILSRSRGTATLGEVLKTLGLPEETEYDFKTHHPKYVAKIAVLYANALLEELSGF